MQPSLPQLLPLIVATSFAAGINVYATVLTLGLLSRAGVVSLPPALGLLGSWWTIATSGALFFIEVFADKVPYIDLFWNFLHTFVRIPAAALIAYQAGAQLPPPWQMAASALGAAVALAAHLGKTALRIGVNATPEPLTNFAVSAAEDSAAIGLTWLATVHPYAAASITVLCLLGLALAFRLIVKGLREAVGRFKRNLKYSRPRQFDAGPGE
jgi:hypothetical protein